MAFVDKAVMAHLGSTLHTGLVGMNAKVADITHADTNKHTIDLASLGIPDNASALLLLAIRSSGTGELSTYPNEGSLGVFLDGHIAMICIVSERLQYALTVASDDFDLYCMGYIIQGRLLG